MSVLGVIQARMGSTRLPGKVLADVAGRPMLRLMLDRLSGGAWDRLVVATTCEARDDPLIELAQACKVAVVRGSEADVLGRFTRCLEAFPAEHVVRLTADCPLSDPEVVGSVVRKHLAAGADYTTNVIPRTFPQGLDVEVMSASALGAAAKEATDPAEREHVTPFLYRHPERFRLANVRHDEPLGSERWTVDTLADLDFLRDTVARLGRDWAAGWQLILSVVGRRARVRPGEVGLRPAFERDADLLQEWRNDPETVLHSVTRAPVSPTEHAAWLRRTLDDPAHRLWIGEIDGEPVGQVRVDVRAGTGEVSITVDRAQRGRGMGTRLLVALVGLLASDYQVRRLVARIRPDNLASRHAFRRAGFVEDREADGLVWLQLPA